MKNGQFTRVVVIGGSIAGLMAARVLSDFAGEVLILERDAVPDAPEPRKGQPQTRHLHGLLAQGLALFTSFFPGLEQSLVEGGTILGDMGLVIRWYNFGGYKKQYESGLTGALMSRPFLEWQIRRRVLALPNVSLLAPCAVEGLETGAGRGRVSGVRVIRRDDGNRRETIQADLVVDASGRGSATPRWLASLGYASPPVSEVKVDLGYATRLYERRPGDLIGAELLMVSGTYPDSRGGFVFPIEGERWIVTLAGMHGDHPPTDEQSFMAFARSLAAPDVYNLLGATKPLSPIIPHKFPSSRRHHYERLHRFPEGFLVMGDAVCSFNPIYGQGMTSAALQAQALQRLLAQKGEATALWRPFFKQVASVVNIPWQSAVGEDLRYPETEGHKAPGTDLINAYVAKVHQATQHDTVVYGQFLRVMNMMASPTSLFRPAIMRRVLRRRQPAALPARPQLVPGNYPAGNS